MLSKPEDNLLKLGLQQGQVVADLGAGTGHHSIEAAKQVGSSGRVYAVEIQKDKLDLISRNAQEQNVSNVKVIWGDIDEPMGVKLDDGLCDAIILANVFFQIEKKNDCVREAFRILKPGGKILLLDWQDSFGHMGPHPDHVVTPNMARPYFQEVGLEEVDSFDAGHHHYGLIFRKPR